MANINLLTPTSIYGRTVNFQTATGTVISAPLKSYIAAAVPAGKTQFITGLSWQLTSGQFFSNSGTGPGLVKIYKRLPDSTDLFIINSSSRALDLTKTALYGDYEIFSKSSGLYLQEGEALIIEVYSDGSVAPSVRGYMTYLEIE